MMRVLYLAFESALGGAEICLLALLDGLAGTGGAPGAVSPIVVAGADGPLVAELQRRRVDVRVEPRMSLLVREACSPLHALGNLRRYARVVGRLRRLIRDERIDLVHACVTPALKYGGAAARLAGVPAVATLHDMLAPPFRPAARRAIAANLNRLYHRVFVPSAATAEVARGAGLAPDRLLVVPNGVDVARFRGDPAGGLGVRAELGVPAGAPLVGMVGRFLPAKGHDLLLRALARMAPEVRALLVGGAGFAGEASWRARVERLASDPALDGRVVLAGWRADMPRVLSALDVYVHPATEPETLPTAVLEAMACGLPVVATALGGCSEIVGHGVTGCLVAPGDDSALAAALTSLLADPARARAMGAAGRARVEAHFALAGHCGAVLAEYGRLRERRR